ncbi:MAG TPA: prepilin-type N-terminal cleavage/methylation domain-containing protein [Gemmatimonadales bacterium]|nr:prepilin-type N-terminal cleavage/methylation domain-containing protein [Gemmatimonadales bacterium]
MLKRRGFTLVELMIAIVLLGVVGLAMAQTMTVMLRTTSAQVQMAAAQGTARTGSLAIPQEFREIGYDTIPGIGTDTDLEAIAGNQITFRAMRGMGVTCSVEPTGFLEFRVLKPAFGLRVPQATDSFRLFVEGDKNLGADDQWVSMRVSGVDLNSTCGANAAIRLTLASRPQMRLVGTGGLVDVTSVYFFVGGPIRWYERMQYAPVVDATSGQTYLGARSLNLGEELQPMIGPLSGSSGFALTYYAADGSVLNPASAPKINVRSIGISMTGSTTAPITMSGSSARARGQAPVVTRVALRNNLRVSP